MAKTSDYSAIITEVLEKEGLLEDFNLGGLLDELSRFNDAEPPEAKESGIYVTAAAVSSESGDTDLFLEQGLYTAKDIALKTFLLNPTWWCGFENMNVYDLQHLEIRL